MIIKIDYSKMIHIGSPEVFGMCKMPNLLHCDDVMPKLKETGITLFRTDLYPEAMIPVSICADVESYVNNTNNIQNPENWHFGHLHCIPTAKKYGMKVMTSMCYVPEWLTYSGTYKGIPMNWEVYEDILSKSYSRYADRIDYCEILNELVYFMDLTGSPYKSKHEAAADMYFHAARAIRKVNPKAVIGGLSTEGPFTEELEALFQDDRFRATTGLFDFISFHDYSSENCSQGSNQFRKLLQKYGYGNDIPIFVNEWNITPQWRSNEEKLYTHRSLTYAGKNLAYFMNEGVRACFFGAYPRNYPSDGFHEFDEVTTLAIYDWDEKEKTGTLLPMMSAYKMAGVTLGLSHGDFRVVETEYPWGITAACGVINSQGAKGGYLVNDRPVSVDIIVELYNSGQENIEQIKAFSAHPKSTGDDLLQVEVAIEKDCIRCCMSLPAFSVTGLLL